MRYLNDYLQKNKNSINILSKNQQQIETYKTGYLNNSYFKFIKL